jgi:hypothetical protein
MIPFWCLMPKGEKLRSKQMDQLQMDQLPLVNFKNSPNCSYCKIWSLVGVNFDYGKKGEFLTLDQFHSWIISLCA